MSTGSVARASALPPTAATATPSPASAPAGTSAGQPVAEQKPAGIPADQGLELLAQAEGLKGKPIVTPSGDVYMETSDYDVTGGKIVLRFMHVARIDASTGRMLPDAGLSDYIRRHTPRDPGSVTEQSGHLYYKRVEKGDGGQLVSTLEPMSAEEEARVRAALQRQQHDQSQQQWVQDQYDWINKLNTLAGGMKVVGYTGNLVRGLAQGPHPFTGGVGVHWMSAYMTAQIIDSQAGGKLIPKFMKEGAVSKALDWGTQGYFLLQTIPDALLLAQRFPTLGRVMHTVTAPTRAIIGGVAKLGSTLVGSGTSAAQAAGAAAAASSAAQAAAASAATAGAATDAVQTLAGAFNDGAQLVGTGQLAEAAAVVLKDGTTHVVSKELVHQVARQMTASTTTGVAGTAERALGTLPKFFGNAMKMLEPALRPLMIGGSVFGVVSGALYANTLLKTQGAKALVTTRQGRGAALGFLNGATFLAMMVMPQTAMVTSAVLNVANTVIGGVSMLDSYGLFGGGGFLDSQAVRAAFLIPPLTPLGLVAMWFKRREKQQIQRAVAAKQQLEQAGKAVGTLRDQVTRQLAGSGAVTGAKSGDGGSLLVETGIDEASLNKASSDADKLPEGLSEDQQRKLRLVTQRTA